MSAIRSTNIPAPCLPPSPVPRQLIHAKEAILPKTTVNGISINYEIDGDGAPNGTIVLINGLADDLLSWGFQIPALVEAGYRVLRFDNRGIGQSDRPAGPYSARMLADDAKALVDQLGIKDFHLMGVSMGGMISQEYALAYGDDLKSLTLACTYGTVDNFCQTMFTMWADLAKAIDVPLRHARRVALGLHRTILQRAAGRSRRIRRGDGSARHVARSLSGAACRHPEA